MSRFSAAFMLLFAQLAWGGLVSLAVPPFAVLDRGFYRSSAGIFLGAAVIFVAGRAGLVWRTGGPTSSDLSELAVWTAFVGVFASYMLALWRDSGALRARTFAAALGTGFCALAVSAARWQPDSPLLAVTIYPLALATGSLALGAVAGGMLLGHWYLIDLGLSIEPLRRMLRWYLLCLLLQLAVVPLALVAVAIAAPGGVDAVRELWTGHATLLILRVVLGPLAALALGWLIHRTLAIPQTMAATGLFYVAILAVVVGELLARLVLFRTGIPL